MIPISFMVEGSNLATDTAIEDAWNRKVQKRQPSSIQALKEVLMELWTISWSWQLLRPIYMYTHNMIQKVIQFQEHMTKY